MKNTFSKGYACACFILTILMAMGTTTTSAQICTSHSSDNDSSSDNKKQKTMTNQAISNKPVVCKLTSQDLRDRKATTIASLKKSVIERKELPNGYSYKFPGDDASIDQLITFVKTERQCCGFFTFNLSITEDSAMLELTGPTGAKGFIDAEIGM